METSLYEQICCLQKNHWWYKSLEKCLNALLRKLPKGGTVLDAGCGPGVMPGYFGRYG